MATAEDIVIAKLEWASASGSDRQLDDVAGILAIAPPLDIDYVERWVHALGLEDAWERIKAG